MSASDPRLPRMSALKLALLAKRVRAQSADLAAIRAEPLAIIGMGCRFPGGADDPQAFWGVLRAGVDAIGEVPAERWNWREYYDPDPAAPGKMTTRWGGFISQVDSFDAAFFGIAPREALHLDPQQRLFLEVACEALDDAGLPRERLAGSRTGVFVASYHNDYAQAQFAAPATIDAYTSTGTAHSVLANRLSYLFDLRGPSISVDTACSSSLVAVHLACESLRAGESDVVLAGGVSLMLTPGMTVALSKWGFLTEDGRCKTFDARANGFVRGEGCGVLVLKRLSDALADNDTVLALVRGSAVNQDGRSNALTAPNGLAQQAVVREALARAGVAPDEIGYIEAHGTGTALGDPIEVEALAEVFAPRPPQSRCVIGSVKTNIGHTEAAAGLAGMIKVVLSLRNETIPAHLHFRTPNPHLDFERLPFEIPLTARPWPRTAVPRLAGVSSFGFGGTNAHVVLEEAPVLPQEDAPEMEPPAHFLAISAQSPQALSDVARRYRDCLQRPDVRVGDLCYSAATARDHLDFRGAVVGSSAKELSDQLETFLTQEAPSSGATGRRVPGQRQAIAFVFSGQGPQWWAMGRELYGTEPEFTRTLDACDAAMRAHAPWSLLEELGRDETTSRLGETQIAQPALFALQVALAAVWRSWGIEASVVVGHSMGEIAAAHVAGALSLESAARLVFTRARIMQAATGLGRMAAVDLPRRAAEDIAMRSSGLLSLAAVNGPQSCVLSGDATALATALTALTAQGVGHRLLPVNYAFHSAQMDPFEGELVRALGVLQADSPRCVMISSVTGEKLAAADLDAAYWGRNLRRPVQFAAAIDAALDLGIDVFVEMSPHPVLGAPIAATCEHRGVAANVLASLRRGRPEGLTLRAAAAALYVHGASLDWSALFLRGGRRISLPSYPWQRRRYWQVAAPQSGRPEGAGGLARPGSRSRSSPSRLFESRIRATDPAFLADHRVGATVVVPATVQIETILTAMGASAAGRTAVLSDLILREPLVLGANEERVVQCALAGTAAGFTFEVLSAPTEENESSAWVLHASGSTRSETSLPAIELDLTAVRSSCSQQLDVAVVYESHACRGLNFGPAFRGVRRLWRGTAQALGEIALPESAGAVSEFRCHPALLDACLQVTLAALPEGGATDLFLPVVVDTLKVYDRLPDCVWSHATLRKGAVDSMLTADVTVSDPAGTVLLRVEGLRLARASLERFRASRADHVAGLYRTEWRKAASPKALTAPRRWLVLADDDAAGAELGARLLGESASVAIANLGGSFQQRAGRWSVNPAAAEDFRRLLAESAPGGGFTGIVYLATAAAATEIVTGSGPSQAMARAGAAALHLFQALLKVGGSLPGVWIATSGARSIVTDSTGADPVDAVGAMLWGLARSLVAEHPDLSVRLVDLDPRAPWLEPLVSELRAAADGESEVAVRGPQRFVARLAVFAPDSAPRQALRLEPGGSGLLEDLSLRPLAPATPGPGEVEIDVEVSGLNFRDVLNALGMYPGKAGPLGGECAGVVRAVGADVRHFAPGDAVMAFAPGSFASRVIARESWVARRPRNMNPAQSAALPVAFLTARYALERLAGLQQGEHVLIHAGAGGVGMAAIQLARATGATVFATAGSVEKREYLARLGVDYVFDSRSLSFAGEIRKITGGAGVHVVLNALADDFIPASLDVLAPGGRFLEMGKRGIWSPAAVAARRADVRYYPFDLGEAAEADRELIPGLFAALIEDFEASRLQPLPLAAWPLNAASAAFRTMAQARHIGKIVLTHPRTGAQLPLRADATYLISGGLGALGIATAKWLASRGARQIVLLGRSEPDAQVRATLETLESDGVRVRTVEGDVADAEAMARLFGELKESPAPLRGIIHAAGVLDDGVIVQQSWPRCAAVLASKAGGGALMAHYARGLPLDFFVCYSSATGVLSSAGQGPYAMANAYLDALCHNLRSAGVAATSIQWGPWEQGGMAARISGQHATRLARQGVNSMTADVALAALGVAIEAGASEVAVLEIDRQTFAAAVTTHPRRSFYQELGGSTPESKLPQHDTFMLRYHAAPSSQRRPLLAEQVRTLALRSLGLDANTVVEDARPLKDLGLDSLMAVELRNALARSLEIALPATMVFDYPSVTALAGYLLERLGGSGGKPVRAPSLPDEVTSLHGLSEDAAEALLLAELDSPGARGGSAS